MKHSRGFAWLPVLIITLGVAVIVGGGAYYLSWSSHQVIREPLPPRAVIEASSTQPQVGSVSSDGIKKYEGAWFDISYPENFSAKKEGPDEASFTSPDNSVQFYVYSPQWNGNPVSYLEPLPNEIIESDESKTEINPDDTYPKKVTRYVTFAAKDGSYKRSFVSIKMGFNEPQKGGEDAVLHLVFGIKYANQATYTKYLNEYLAFKKSLTQYAD